MAALAFAGDLARLRTPRPARVGSGAAAAAAAAARQPGSLPERVLHAFAANDLPVHRQLSLPTLSLDLACPGAPARAGVRVGLSNLAAAALTGRAPLGRGGRPAGRARGWPPSGRPAGARLCSRYSRDRGGRHLVARVAPSRLLFGRHSAAVQASGRACARVAAERSSAAQRGRRMPAAAADGAALARAGIVCAARYLHRDDDAAGAAAAPAAGARDELVAALSAIRCQVFGEGFPELLAAGATRRASVRADLDVLCYQPPELRAGAAGGSAAAGLAFRTVTPRDRLEPLRRLGTQARPAALRASQFLGLGLEITWLNSVRVECVLVRLEHTLP